MSREAEPIAEPPAFECPIGAVDCRFCANDREQCHADLDCEARAWLNGYCGPHQPDKGSYL